MRIGLFGPPKRRARAKSALSCQSTPSTKTALEPVYFSANGVMSDKINAGIDLDRHAEEATWLTV